tara:strand:- start:116 stop:541 length:426 start_codon:yes stop_codon:yes gene_type:complete
MKLAAMAIGVKSKRVMNTNHHGMYSFKSWKKVTEIKIIERAKIWIAMNITPHLIGRQPKHEAFPTLSWEHAHMQQQHGLKLYMSWSLTSDGTYGFSANGFSGTKLIFSSASLSLPAVSLSFLSSSFGGAALSSLTSSTTGA